MVKILVFGDSITWGAFDLEKGGWVERLKTEFLKTYKEEGISIYNLGISSNDSKGVLHQLEADISKFKVIEPENLTILFSIGSNDPRYIKTKDQVVIPIEEFKKNIKEIINISRKHTQKIIFTGLMIIDETKTKPWVEDEYWEEADLKIYNDIIENICKEEDILFIPTWDLLVKEDLHDGLHPTAVGHEKIFHRVKEFLEKNAPTGN